MSFFYEYSRVICCNEHSSLLPRPREFNVLLNLLPSIIILQLKQLDVTMLYLLVSFLVISYCELYSDVFLPFNLQSLKTKGNVNRNLSLPAPCSFFCSIHLIMIFSSYRVTLNNLLSCSGTIALYGGGG